MKQGNQSELQSSVFELLRAAYEKNKATMKHPQEMLKAIKEIGLLLDAEYNAVNDKFSVDDEEMIGNI
jgi:hypothetical protein